MLFKELWQLVSGQTKFKELWQPYFNLLLGGQSRQGGRIGGASEEGGFQTKYDFCKRHYLFTNAYKQVEVYEEKLENIKEQYQLGMDSLEGRTRKGI